VSLLARKIKGFEEKYITYCSFEAAQAIRSYLDFRRREGETITKDSYQKTV
jgi:hypothetical protein